MNFTIKKAERKQTKIKMGFAGPSGSGKTLSALYTAFGLTGDWNKIAVIDTENGSSHLYAHLGPFEVLELKPPYTPQTYVKALQYVNGLKKFDVVIIDSITHEWNWCIEAKDDLGESFRNWKKITPQHTHFVNGILQVPMHVIVTMRKKQNYALSEVEENGKKKQKVEKVGLKDIQREGFEYELTLHFDMDMDNMASTSKDRTGLFANQGSFVPDVETGKKILEWCMTGEPPKIEPAKTPTTTLIPLPGTDPKAPPVIASGGNGSTPQTPPTQSTTASSGTEKGPSLPEGNPPPPKPSSAKEIAITEMQQQVKDIMHTLGWNNQKLIDVCKESFDKLPNQLSVIELDTLIAFYKPEADAMKNAQAMGAGSAGV